MESELYNINETTKHIQEVLLMMLKDFDKICKKNNIKYYLNGGNVIGAVRHKGFIPWDDDVDVMLYQDDMVKLMKILRSDEIQSKYYLEESLKDWPMYYSKLHLRGTHVKEKENFNGRDKDCHGIFIDIFPMSYSPMNILGRKWGHSQMSVAEA